MCADKMAFTMAASMVVLIASYLVADQTYAQTFGVDAYP